MIATQHPSRRHSAGVLLLIVIWLSATAWARPLMLPDEGRYVGVAWEMLRSGDWLTPTLDGLPFFHKPPLFYWLTAGALSVFGLNEWAARMASLLGATAAAFALYAYVARYVSQRAAWMTLLVLLTQPLFFGGAQFANLDMLVAACITATILLAACAAENAYRGIPCQRELAFAYLCAALGVLAKGLIGVVLPALVVVVWLVALRRFRTILAMIWWPAIILFMIVVAPWFIAMHLRHADFLDYFFVVQHFRRYTQGGFNNAAPIWFYPVALAVLGMPWFAWLYRTCTPSYWAGTEHRPIRLLMWIWMIVVTAFFSAPQSKLIGYILPAVLPLSFIITDSAGSVYSASLRARKLWWASAAIAMILCIGIVTALSINPQRSTRDIAHALKVQRAPDEPVFFLYEYYYDIVFYAGLRSPVRVVESWTIPEYANRDSWRKELIDAAKFNPQAASLLLLTPEALQPALCGTPVSWVIVPGIWVAQHAFLVHAREIMRHADTVLFRLDRSSPALANALQCRGRPNDGSANK